MKKSLFLLALAAAGQVHAIGVAAHASAHAAAHATAHPSAAHAAPKAAPAPKAAAVEAAQPVTIRPIPVPLIHGGAPAPMPTAAASGASGVKR